MIGVAVIGALALYIFVAWACIRWVRGHIVSPPKRVAATVILWLLFLVTPIADGLIGRWEFGRLCTKEAGTRINRSVVGVEGFQSNDFFEDWLTKLAYKYVEYERYPGTVLRKSVGPDGRIVEEKIGVPTSRYAFRYSVVALPNHMRKGQYAVVDMRSNEILSKRVNLSYSGGWLERTLGQVGGGTGYTCPPGSFRMSDLLANTLVPKKKN